MRLREKRAALRPVLTPRAVLPPPEERAASPELPAAKKRRGGPKPPAPTKEMCAKKFYELNAVGDHVLVRQKRVTDCSDLAVWGAAASAYRQRRGAARAARQLSLQSGSARGDTRCALRLVRPQRSGGASAQPFLCCTRRSGQGVAAAPPALTQVLRRTLAQASAT